MVTTDKVTVTEFSPHIGKTTTDYIVNTEKKDQATLIAELISRVTSLEDDMEFVLKHIRILEVDRQVEVISPSWDMKVKNYEMPNGGKVAFEYDEDGVGKISLEAMDRLMELVGAEPTEICDECVIEDFDIYQGERDRDENGEIY